MVLKKFLSQFEIYQQKPQIIRYYMVKKEQSFVTKEITNMKKSRVLTLGLACFLTAVTGFSALAATSGGGGRFIAI